MPVLERASLPQAKQQHQARQAFEQGDALLPILLATSQKLFSSGMISGDRGKITVNNREGLLNICCECCAVANNQHMGYAASAAAELIRPRIQAV